MNTKTITTSHPIIKWLIIGLFVIFIYELYKQIKAGVLQGAGGLLTALENALQGVLTDLGNMFGTLLTNPISTIAAAVGSLFSTLSNLLSGILANPLAGILAIPSGLLNYLDYLFAGEGTADLNLSPLNSTAANSNTFIANGTNPSAVDATSSMPDWLTVSPTTTLGTFGTVQNPNPQPDNILANFPSNTGTVTDSGLDSQEGFSATLGGGD